MQLGAPPLDDGFARFMRSERWLIAGVVFGAFGLAAYAMWLLAHRGGAPRPELGAASSFFGPGNPLGLNAAPSRQQQEPQTHMFTMRLSATRGTRVFQPPPGTARWRIEGRNIGPAGSFVSLSTDSGFNPMATIDIPAGGRNEFTIAGNQVVYGRSTIDGIELTIVASVTS